MRTLLPLARKELLPVCGGQSSSWFCPFNRLSQSEHLERPVETRGVTPALAT
jgi:hypothetical protein